MEVSTKQLLNFTYRQCQTAQSSGIVLLIHGLFGGLDNLNMLARHLEKSFDVISIDVRNHGASFHDKKMTYQDMANDVLELLTHLNTSKVSIVGHSMGGKIAMQFALQYPQYIEKLIIADIAPVQYEHSHQNIITGLKSINLVEINNRKDADNQLAKYVAEIGIRQFLLKNLIKAEDGFTWRANIKNIEAAYSNIITEITQTKPFLGETLFIKGGNSDYILASHKEKIMNLFPNSKARVMSGVGHWLHAEKPETFNKITENFIKK